MPVLTRCGTYHKPGCRHLRRIPDDELEHVTREYVRALGFEACNLCSSHTERVQAQELRDRARAREIAIFQERADANERDKQRVRLLEREKYVTYKSAIQVQKKSEDMILPPKNGTAECSVCYIKKPLKNLFFVCTNHAADTSTCLTCSKKVWKMGKCPTDAKNYTRSTASS